MPKQTTLLQTWGYSGNENVFQDGGEDVDSLLIEALDQSNIGGSSRAENNKEDNGETEGFDHESGHTWIYPINFPVREYQLSISESCLYANTLVSLPTGLGKTFIAAVVMYNFYRWYPEGLVLFLAPTKPLVAQQIQACFKIMGIPAKDVAQMTGSNPVHSRKKEWTSKRVFFMTPQVLVNDLSRGLLPTCRIKCVVLDEAHRACGDYAYCQVVKELKMAESHFRVVALSATPGNDVKSVQDVLLNLGISKIELRSEDSPDISPYTFQRNVEKIVVPLSAEMEGIKEKYASLVDSYLGRLSSAGVIATGKKAGSVSKFGLLQSRNEFRQNPPSRFATDRSLKGSMESNFASCISLLHAYELLLQHGLRPFHNFLMKTIDPNTGNKRLRSELARNELWGDILGTLENKFSGDGSNSLLNASRPNLGTQFALNNAESSSFALGHPKLNKLKEVVLSHFVDKGSTPSRVMIFSQYRDSVQEIVACLHSQRPKVRAMEFIGQSGTKAKKGLTQKEQIEIIRRFKEGGYNTLVSTCVGEEGLDIGEVDLIICFDVSKSPIQLVQRMGRTGRKRSGRIVVLVTKGKEEMTYNQCLYSKKSINKAILDKHKLSNFLQASPRMVPFELKPKCHKIEMIVNDLETESVKKPKGKKEASAGKVKRTTKTSGKEVTTPPIGDESSTTDPFETSKSSFFLKNSKKKIDAGGGGALQKMISSYTMYSTLLDSPGVSDEEGVAIQPSSTGKEHSSKRNPEIEEELVILDSPGFQSNPQISDEEESGEFDDLYSDGLVLDVKGFKSDLMQDDSEDYSELETAHFGMDDVYEIYNEIVNGGESKNPGVHTSTPCAKPKPIPLSQSPRIESKGDENLANFDMDFDHEDFFQDISSGGARSINSTPKRGDKSLYSATQLASFINKSARSSRKLYSPASKRSKQRDLSALTEANFDVQLNSDEDMFADSLGEEKEETSMRAESVIYTPIKALSTKMGSLISSPIVKVKKARVSFLEDDSKNCYSRESFHKKESAEKKKDDSILLLYEKPSELTQTSPLVTTKRRQRKLMNFDSDSELEDDSPFAIPPTRVNQSKKKNARKGAAAFIQREVDVDDSEGSSDEFADESNKGLDAYDPSFVDDATQHESAFDAKAMYLQSSKERQGIAGKFKMPSKPLAPVTADIFSQMPTNDESEDEYENDSFCVDDDFVEFSDTNNGEDTMALIEENTGPSKKSRILRPVNDSDSSDDEDVQKSSTLPNKVGRVESSDDDDEVGSDQKFSPMNNKVGKDSSDITECSSSRLGKVEKEDSNMLDSDQECILINTSEFHTCHDLITTLKYTFHVGVSVRSFEGAGFILSPRLAVDRIPYSLFLNGGQRSKMIARCQQMNDLYTRPFIILELDDDSSKSSAYSKRSKYADMILSQLSQSNIRLLFSKNQKTSADIIYHLLKKEAQKGFSFRSSLQSKGRRSSIFNDEDFKVVSFYKSVPGIGVGLGYLLASNYSSTASFAKTAVSTLMRNGNLDEERARKVQDFLRRKFAPEMTEFGK